MQILANSSAEYGMAVNAPNRLGVGQIAILGAIGVVLWPSVTVLIHFGIAAGLFGGALVPLLFAAALPSAWLLIWLGKRAAALQPDQLVAGVALASAAALLCDGVALAWAPTLYGADAASLLPAIAWLLWTYGICLALAFINARREGA